MSLDLMINEKQIVIDLPAPTSAGFLELGKDVKVLSIRNLRNESERISRTKSYRRSFYKKITAHFSIGTRDPEIHFNFIGAGANRIVYRNNHFEAVWSFLGRPYCRGTKARPNGNSGHLAHSQRGYSAPRGEWGNIFFSMSALC